MATGSEAKRAITIKIHYAKRTANQNAGKETAINFRQKEKQQQQQQSNNNSNKNKNNSGVSYMKNYCGCELLSTYLKLISTSERETPLPHSRSPAATRRCQRRHDVTRTRGDYGPRRWRRRGDSGCGLKTSQKGGRIRGRGCLLRLSLRMSKY